MTQKTKVALLKQQNYETIKEGVKQLVDLVGGFKKFLKASDRIWIKPNVSRPAPGIPTCTDPRIVVAIIELLREELGTEKIVVADNPVFAYPSSKAYVEIGMEQSVKRAGADIVKLDESDWILTEIPDGKVLKEVLIPKLYYETDAIINVPKWKTHLQTDVTLCVKNFHGVIHWDYRRIHHTDQLPQKLVDILKVVKPAFNIVDGVIGVDGYGATIGGDYKEIGLIAAGKDPVAVDAVCSKVMGYDPWLIDTTRIADRDGLGIGDLQKIQVVGTPLNQINVSFHQPNLKLIGMYPNLDFRLGGVCRGCRSRMKMGFEIARKQGKLSKLDPTTIICGINAVFPKPSEKLKNLLVVGDCTLLRRKLSEDKSSVELVKSFDHSRIEGKKFVRGCPVWFTDIVDALFSDEEKK